MTKDSSSDHRTGDIILYKGIGKKNFKKKGRMFQMNSVLLLRYKFTLFKKNYKNVLKCKDGVDLVLPLFLLTPKIRRETWGETSVERNQRPYNICGQICDRKNYPL